MRTRVVGTSLGPVEVGISSEAGEAVVFFPGGHSTAATPNGADLYTELGYRVVTFSRPGYGRTAVGDLTAAEFVPAVAEVCAGLGITTAAATVGMSFGGLQAVHVATGLPHLAPRLVLHSCAPSSLPYPDGLTERLVAPLAFGPRTQRLTWRAVRLLTASDRGLRVMMSSLSRLPVRQWWSQWSRDDRAAARGIFSMMGSGSGFVTDLRQARPERSSYRESTLRSVPCPTLITASRHDGGVAFEHTEDLRRTIPDARLVETGAPSHFHWLGASRGTVSRTVREFFSA
ncbi:pimeloyl-ACP methyl ester carboxylesterase [Actinopolyspora lacussalsi]|nr:pimeloyl-ACP methyl ester carboxylesterase [Actinopolyspora lacussalsi]